jgi:hypothetical protein
VSDRTKIAYIVHTIGLRLGYNKDMASIGAHVGISVLEANDKPDPSCVFIQSSWLALQASLIQAAGRVYLASHRLNCVKDLSSR